MRANRLDRYQVTLHLMRAGQSAKIRIGVACVFLEPVRFERGGGVA